MAHQIEDSGGVVARASRGSTVFLVITGLALAVLAPVFVSHQSSAGLEKLVTPSLILAAGLYLLLLAWRFSGLEIGQGHVIYRRWLRTHRLEWKDVDRVDSEAWRLVLHAPSAKVWVPLGAFSQPEAVRGLVHDAIASSREMKADGASSDSS